MIVNHERRLYFVEDTGRAIRYPVAIGKVDDQWEGMETVTAKRENPTWYPPEEIQLEMDVPAVVPPAAKIRSDPGRCTSAIRSTEFMERTGPAPLAAR